MDTKKLSSETNGIIWELINIARGLNKASELEIAKNGLIDSATLLAGTIEGLKYETNEAVIVAKINQATDAAGRTIFWIDYLTKETAIDSLAGELMHNNIGKITNQLVSYRSDVEKNITTSFQGEWLLED